MGHMSRAAKEQGVAQPSLSKAIRLLEEELGTRLFDRDGRSVRLNAAGKAFLPHVERALGALDDGRRELADIAVEGGYEVAVSAVALHWATGMFRAFCRKRPEVRLRLFQRSSAGMLRQLARREVDLCLMADPQEPSVEWTPLVTGEVWVMVPPAHRLAGRGTVALASLRDEPAILSRPGGPLRDVVDALYREAGVEPTVVCESDDVLTMRGLVLAGLGIQFVPDLRRALAREADPCYLRLVEPERSVQVGLAWPREGYRSQAAREFARFASAFALEG